MDSVIKPIKTICYTACNLACSVPVLTVFFYGILFLLGTILTADATELPDPTEQFRPFVEKLRTILTDSDLQGEEKNVQRREKAMVVVAEHFDYQEMSKRVLGKTWRKLNANEQEYFASLFTRLLESTYLTKIEGYSKQEVIFKRQRLKGNRAQIITNILDNNSVVVVSYILLLKNGVWRVYDVVVEGVSLVRNYREQFRGILRKDSYGVLLKQVETKVAGLEADYR
jgi:phospholipid transport system substrate-binding protein